MTRYIATAVCLLVLAVLGYEIWLRDWLESRHCVRLLSEMAAKERRADELIAAQERFRVWADDLRPELDDWDAIARQFEEIRGLREIEPKRELA